MTEIKVTEAVYIEVAAERDHWKAQVSRLMEEQGALMDSYDQLYREAKELWDALVACAEYAPNDVKILINAGRLRDRWGRGNPDEENNDA
jgi:hypothetical protein